MLDLVDNSPLPKLREKASRIGLGEVSLVGRFQVDVLQSGKSGAAKGRLPGLARPGHGNKRVLLEQGGQAARDFTLDHGR